MHPLAIVYIFHEAAAPGNPGGNGRSRMRRTAIILGVFLLAAGGCRQAPPKTARLTVLTSFLPLWVFTVNVVGDRPGVEVALLIPSGRSPHDYQLTPGDLKKINRADLFIVNGYYLEEFLESAVNKAKPGLKVLRAAEAAPPIVAGPASPGLLAGPADPHANVNPHVFASPTDAAVMVRAIAAALAEADPAGAAVYRRNGEAYAARLTALGDEIRAVVQAAPNRQVVTYHNAFAYLARATGLEIVGTIESAPGQEPSAGELSRLAERIRQTGARAVLSEPQYSPRLAETLARETGAPLAVLDPADTGAQTPDSYERIMQKNLETLRRILAPEPK